MTNREVPRVLLRVIVAGLLVLAGCAGRPEGVMVPSGEAPPGVSLVNLLVATTRAPSDQPGVLFSGERGTQLELRDIAISIPPDANRTIGQVQWPEKLPADPMKHFSTVSVKPVENAKAGRV
ncbi:MAG: esterase, partial [Rhizobium oryzihabitans]